MTRGTIPQWVAGGVAGALAFVALYFGAAAAMPSEEPRAPEMRIAGQLQAPAFWSAYKAQFLTPEGRIVDDLNGGISHSEGQGYGLLLSVAADDRAAFDRILAWTRANLFVRDDYLAAWRWEPNHKPNVTDRNDAADGDLLIAWALIEAADHWHVAAYRSLARHMARSIADELLHQTPAGWILRPATAGFEAGDRADGPVINLSYWVFPALQRLGDLEGGGAWTEAAANGLKLIAASRFGPAKLPSDWISLKDGTPSPAQGFPAVFGYNALRIPLYLAWSGLGQRQHFAPFEMRWADQAPDIVDIASGHATEPLTSPGYRALAALVECVMAKRRFDDTLRDAPVDHYYPATLMALTQIAIHERYPQCW